jgi:hypothetical protein
LFRYAPGQHLTTGFRRISAITARIRFDSPSAMHSIRQFPKISHRGRYPSGGFGISVGHPSAILILPAAVKRMPPKTSSMYPSSISRALCSDGMRCIKPLAPSRNETNSSRVNGGADGAILGICPYGGRDQVGFAEPPGDSNANALHTHPCQLPGYRIHGRCSALPSSLPVELLTKCSLVQA